MKKESERKIEKRADDAVEECPFIEDELCDGFEVGLCKGCEIYSAVQFGGSKDSLGKKLVMGVKKGKFGVFSIESIDKAIRRLRSDIKELKDLKNNGRTHAIDIVWAEKGIGLRFPIVTSDEDLVETYQNLLDDAKQKIKIKKPKKARLD